MVCLFLIEIAVLAIFVEKKSLLVSLLEKYLGKPRVSQSTSKKKKKKKWPGFFIVSMLKTNKPALNQFSLQILIQDRFLSGQSVPAQQYFTQVILSSPVFRSPTSAFQLSSITLFFFFFLVQCQHLLNEMNEQSQALTM